MLDCVIGVSLGGSDKVTTSVPILLFSTSFSRLLETSTSSPIGAHLLMDLDHVDASEAGDGALDDSALVVVSGVDEVASEVSAAAADEPDPAVEQDVCAAHPFQLYSFCYRRLSTKLTLSPLYPPPSTLLATLSPSFLIALWSCAGWPSPGPG